MDNTLSALQLEDVDDNVIVVDTISKRYSAWWW